MGQVEPAPKKLFPKWVVGDEVTVAAVDGELEVAAAEAQEIISVAASMRGKSSNVEVMRSEGHRAQRALCDAVTLAMAIGESPQLAEQLDSAATRVEWMVYSPMAQRLFDDGDAKLLFPSLTTPLHALISTKAELVRPAEKPIWSELSRISELMVNAQGQIAHHKHSLGNTKASGAWTATHENLRRAALHRGWTFTSFPPAAAVQLTVNREALKLLGVQMRPFLDQIADRVTGTTSDWNPTNAQRRPLAYALLVAARTVEYNQFKNGLITVDAFAKHVYALTDSVGVPPVSFTEYSSVSSMFNESNQKQVPAIPTASRGFDL